MSFQTLGFPLSGSVSQILTNVVLHPRFLLICPQMSGQINDSTAAWLISPFAAGVGTLEFSMNSLFLSSPATSGPQA